jgi:DNA-binding PadR family transcriptional regulator
MGDQRRPGVMYDILRKLEAAGHNMLLVSSLPNGHDANVTYLAHKRYVDFYYQPGGSTIKLTEDGRAALQRLEEFAEYVLSGAFEEEN